MVSLNGAVTVLGGSGADEFDLDLIGTQYTGFSTGEKRGSSTWTLTGANGAAWSVFDGTLLVNGTAGDMTVNGGVLGGTGTVGNTVINGGALAPGNSIGTLNVAGNLTFAAGGYSVEVEGAASDLTNVTGLATLSGGAVGVTYLPTGTIVRRYTILTAAGGLGGTEFSGITDNAPGIVSRLSYDASNAYLDVDLTMRGITGLTANTAGVASVLDAYFDRTGAIPAAFAFLDAVGLNQLTGEVATGAMGAGMDATSQFLNLIGDAGSGGAVGTGGDPLEYTAGAAARADMARGTGPLSSTRALAALSGESEDAAAKAADALAMGSSHAVDNAFATRWHLWGSAYGGGEQVDGNATVGSADLSARTWGLASGITRNFDGGRIGLALGGAGTSFSLAGGLGSGNATSFNAGLHGTGYFGDGYVTAALAYGYHATRTSRAVPGDTLSARFGAQTFGGRLEAGYRLNLGGVALTPFAAAEATAYRLPGYTETSALGGPFALAYASQTETAIRTELGARTAIALGSNARLTGRAAWVWNADSARAVTAAFQALPGTSFTINGAQPARHAALLKAGVEAAFGNVTAKLAATGEFSRNVTSFGAQAKVGFSW
ncbi:MAG: autotransporter outer membrane beta-barrel domain-containing protein [Rhizobiaceae bacterium]